MWKKVSAILPIALLFAISGCETHDSEFVEWGEGVSQSDTTRLDENNIYYEIVDGQLFIEEESLDKAVRCCT